MPGFLFSRVDPGIRLRRGNDTASEVTHGRVGIQQGEQTWRSLSLLRLLQARCGLGGDRLHHVSAIFVQPTLSENDLELGSPYLIYPQGTGFTLPMVACIIVRHLDGVFSWCFQIVRCTTNITLSFPSQWASNINDGIDHFIRSKPRHRTTPSIDVSHFLKEFPIRPSDPCV